MQREWKFLIVGAVIGALISTVVTLAFTPVQKAVDNHPYAKSLLPFTDCSRIRDEGTCTVLTYYVMNPNDRPLLNTLINVAAQANEDEIVEMALRIRGLMDKGARFKPQKISTQNSSTRPKSNG